MLRWFLSLLLSRHENVTVFFGHIHQETHMTAKIAHHSARSLVFALRPWLGAEARPHSAGRAVPEKG
jgi:hypothetical protein